MEITRTKISYETETVPKTLIEFKEWQFSSGSFIDKDFKRFSRLFRNYLKKAITSKGLRIENYNTGHYFLSGFVTDGKQFVYFSFSDVRYFPGKWHQDILIRTAKDAKDYTGGSNCSATLENLATKICDLL